MINFRVSVLAVVALLVEVTSFAAASHGAQEFTASGNFTVPRGAKTITVEAWGAGGGGGAGFTDGGAIQVAGGGGGGGGYVRKVLTVKSNQPLSVTVGQGGAGGTIDPAANGSDGGASTVSSSGTTLIEAGGGAGGAAGSANSAGSGGPGGAANTTAAIVRTGHAGDGASAQQVGLGGTPVQGSVEIEQFFTSSFSQASAASGGMGGRAIPSGPFTRAGNQGGNGHVLISW